MNQLIMPSYHLREITDFRNVATSEGGTYLTEEFNSVEQYRTDIGTDNVIGMVTYQVSSDAGTNERSRLIRPNFKSSAE